MHPQRNMSLLGLGDYDSPAPDGDETSPAAEPNALKLSIVDYEHDEDEARSEDQASEVFGVTLDDPAVHNAAPKQVGLGSVQVSITKKPAAVPAAPAAASAAVAEEGAVSERSAVFTIPDSPEAEVDARLSEKFLGIVRKTGEGYSINEHIRNAKSFRNPDILEKLVSYFDVRENGTNYPPQLYDPLQFSREDFYDKLEEARRRFEERQARKPGERVGFRSGSSQQAAAAPAAKPPAAKPPATAQPPAAGLASAAAAPPLAAAAAAAAAALLARPVGEKRDSSGLGGEPAAKRTA